MAAGQHAGGECGTDLSAFQEMVSSRCEGIPYAHLVPVLTRHCGAYADGWEDVGVDRATKLRTIPFALATCREWRDLVTPHTEYAALRLAKFDLTWENRPHQTTADDFVVDRFDRNVVLLSKSWELSSPMSHRLRTAPLSDLADVELDALRGELQAGWGAEALISKGADWQSMERVWVTPSMRE
jgi:hypothetical protein